MGMLSDAAAHLAEVLLEHASETVTYTRGADSASLTAVIGGRRRREQLPPDGKVVLVGEPMEFQFDPTTLIVPAGGSPLAPTRHRRLACSRLIGV